MSLSIVVQKAESILPELRMQRRFVCFSGSPRIFRRFNEIQTIKNVSPRVTRDMPMQDTGLC